MLSGVRRWHGVLLTNSAFHLYIIPRPAEVGESGRLSADGVFWYLRSVGTPKFWKIFENDRKLHMPHSRRHGRPRSSRSQHSNPGGARCLSSMSVVQILAAASIKLMDALFGLVARSDAEWSR